MYISIQNWICKKDLFLSNMIVHSLSKFLCQHFIIFSFSIFSFSRCSRLFNIKFTLFFINHDDVQIFNLHMQTFLTATTPPFLGKEELSFKICSISSFLNFSQHTLTSRYGLFSMYAHDYLFFRQLSQ